MPLKLESHFAGMNESLVDFCESEFRPEQLAEK